MKADITIMSGDGVGPEITREAIKVLQAIESVFNHNLSIKEVLFGGIAIDETGTPYPEETQKSCKNSDAVLLGAVGGPKWSDPNMKVRPEKEGLLEMSIESKNRLVHLDGEPKELKSPIVVKVKPRTLKIFSPNGKK